MSANIMCVVYVKILCAVCMQTCGVYASMCGVYGTCGVYESTCGVYAYVWCVCQNHVRCVCKKFMSDVVCHIRYQIYV